MVDSYGKSLMKEKKSANINNPISECNQCQSRVNNPWQKKYQCNEFNDEECKRNNREEYLRKKVTLLKEMKL